MRSDPRIDAYVATWGALRMEPWRCTIRMARPRAGYGALHLDGLLSACVAQRALRGGALEDSAVPYDIPLPLAVLWRGPHDLPLYAVTDLAPVGEYRQARSTWTRRQASPRLRPLTTSGDPMVPRATQGPYKDMQIPLPIDVADTYTCDLIGDGALIADLCQDLAHIGKKRAQGHGGIVEWQLDPLESFTLLHAETGTRRVMPCEMLDADGGQWLSWTPPYWHPGCHTWCLPTGTLGVDMSRIEGGVP